MLSNLVFFIAAMLTAAPYYSDPTDTCAPAPCAVQSITAHPSWIGGPWISHVDSGANAYMLTVPNGTVISFFERFTISQPFTHAPIRFAADDTAALWVNGSLAQTAAPTDGNAYTVCSDFGVTCTSYTEIDIARWLVIGANELRFDVEQRARYGYGVSWMGEVALTDVGDPPMETPEPGTLVLAGAMIFFMLIAQYAAYHLKKVERRNLAYRHLLNSMVFSFAEDAEDLKKIAREALEDE